MSKIKIGDRVTRTSDYLIDKCDICPDTVEFGYIYSVLDVYEKTVSAEQKVRVAYLANSGEVAVHLLNKVIIVE